MAAPRQFAPILTPRNHVQRVRPTLYNLHSRVNFYIYVSSENDTSFTIFFINLSFGNHPAKFVSEGNSKILFAGDFHLQFQL